MHAVRYINTKGKERGMEDFDEEVFKHAVANWFQTAFQPAFNEQMNGIVDSRPDATEYYDIQKFKPRDITEQLVALERTVYFANFKPLNEFESRYLWDFSTNMPRHHYRDTLTVGLPVLQALGQSINQYIALKTHTGFATSKIPYYFNNCDYGSTKQPGLPGVILPWTTAAAKALHGGNVVVFRAQRNSAGLAVTEHFDPISQQHTLTLSLFPNSRSNELELFCLLVRTAEDLGSLECDFRNLSVLIHSTMQVDPCVISQHIEPLEIFRLFNPECEVVEPSSAIDQAVSSDPKYAFLHGQIQLHACRPVLVLRCFRKDEYEMFMVIFPSLPDPP